MNSTLTTKQSADIGRAFNRVVWALQGAGLVKITRLGTKAHKQARLTKRQARSVAALTGRLLRAVGHSPMLAKIRQLEIDLLGQELELMASSDPILTLARDIEKMEARLNGTA